LSGGFCGLPFCLRLFCFFVLVKGGDEGGEGR